MNKELSHKQIISILLPFTILLIAYFWSYGKSTDVTRPLILKETPWQTMAMPLSNGDIYEFNEEGRVLRTIHTSDFGITNFIGDIQFISRTEFIIYGGFNGASTKDNLTAYTRTTPTKSFNQQEGLWRCLINEYKCVPFTHELPRISQAFHLSFDAKNKHIYLTNTAQHMFYRFNIEGEILDKSNSDDLKFPNQVRIFDQQVWLADTNNKQIKKYDLYDGNLKSPIDTFSPVIDSQCQPSAPSSTLHKINPLRLFSNAPACWPSSLANVDNNIWVGVKNNGMENGEVHIYSKNGQLNSKLDLSNLATPYAPDPISFTQINDHVIFSDLNNLALYSYDLNTKTWASFIVPEIDLILETSLAAKSFYRMISQCIIAVFSLLVLIGLFFGLTQKKEPEDTFESVSAEDAILPQPPAMPFWFQDSFISKYSTWILSINCLLILTGLYLMSTFLNFKSSSDELNFYLLCLSIPTMMIPIIVINYLNKKKRLGIAGRLMLVEKPGGQTLIKQVQEIIKVGERGILIDNTLYDFGGKNGKFLNNLEFKHYLEPRFSVMKTMTEWEYFKFRINNPNKESKFKFLSFIPATLLLSYLFITGTL